MAWICNDCLALNSGTRENCRYCQKERGGRKSRPAKPGAKSAPPIAPARRKVCPRCERPLPYLCECLSESPSPEDTP